MKTQIILANTVDFEIYLRGLELIARDLGLKSFRKQEARDWLVAALKAQIPTLEEVKKQWTMFDPEIEGDPFGILTFWADQEQVRWDRRQPEARLPIFSR